MTRSLKFALVTALVALVAGVHRADAGPKKLDVWMTAKVSVDPTSQAITLASSSQAYAVGTPGLGMSDVLTALDGAYVYAHVVENATGGYDVDALAGHNPQSGAIKVQGATDDTATITTIAPDDYFVLKGQVTAEEEAGGNLYYLVAVSGGGLSSDPSIGYVLATDAEVWSYRP